MWVAAFLALAKLSVQLPVLFLARAKLKIFNFIIRFVLVFMMNKLCWEQKPAKVFFHHKAMLVNISTAVSARVVGFMDSNITRWEFDPTSFPIIAVLDDGWFFGTVLGSVFDIHSIVCVSEGREMHPGLCVFYALSILRLCA